MKVENITFYQSVKIGKREFNTVHEHSQEADLQGINCVFLPDLNLMRVSGGKLERDIYIGMANVRRFECDKLTANVLGFSAEPVTHSIDSKKYVVPEDKPVQSLATKPVENMTEEDEKIVLTAAIKKGGGKTPHPMTGVKKLKETLAKQNKEKK